MLDRGPRHAGVAAGQHLPHLVDAELREHLTLACGVANPRHTILTIAAEKLTPATGPAGQTQVLIAADTPVGGYDPVIADPHGLAAKRFGLRAGGRVVVRPDGYIGAVVALDDQRAVADAQATFDDRTIGSRSSESRQAISNVRANVTDMWADNPAAGCAPASTSRPSIAPAPGTVR